MTPTDIEALRVLVADLDYPGDVAREAESALADAMPLVLADLERTREALRNVCDAAMHVVAPNTRAGVTENASPGPREAKGRLHSEYMRALALLDGDDAARALVGEAGK